jgi:hypothetical protein
LVVLDLYAVVIVKSVFRHRPFIGLSKSDVSVVLLCPGRDVSASLSDVNLAALTRNAVRTQSIHSQVIIYRVEEFRDIREPQANELGQYFTKAAVCRLTYDSMATKVGISVG